MVVLDCHLNSSGLVYLKNLFTMKNVGWVNMFIVCQIRTRYFTIKICLNGIQTDFKNIVYNVAIMTY